MTVLITGATQGLGAEMAKTFAAAGYNVAINSYNQEIADTDGKAVAEVCQTYGVEAECFAADVSDYAQCEAMVKAVTERFGAIDVLVNNAGITKDGLLLRMSEESFDAVMAVNMKSVFNMTRLVTPGMVKKRGGNIINMSSIAGVYGNAGQMNYSASKAAIIGMTKTTAKELGSRNILCNAIAPGPIESPMTESLPEAVREKMLSAISLRRFGKAEEIAQTALFLAQQTYMTGQVLVVDGGMGMG